MIERFNQIKKIFARIIELIPSYYFASDRLTFMCEKLEVLSSDEKVQIRDTFNSVLDVMLESQASDIEIGGFGNQGFVWMRIHGNKERQKAIPELTIDESALFILTVLNEKQRETLLHNKSVDLSYTYFNTKFAKNVRFRGTSYFDIDTIALNMRSISANVRPIESLEFHPNLIKVLSHRYIKFGLSLITGITGSGKSSTLDSIIDYHNKVDPIHIIIISSPLEYVHSSNKAIIRHREVGRDVDSFKAGTIQALRQDPDMVVIGEMRDPDTIMAALEITDTGHKVFSTLHTSSAVESIDRIIAEVEPSEQERVRNRLADVLISVVSQKLVPTLDKKRVLAKEVLIVNPSVKAAIKNNNTSEIYMMINQAGAHGMITMEQDLHRLYLKKIISAENAMAYSNNKNRMHQLITGA